MTHGPADHGCPSERVSRTVCAESRAPAQPGSSPTLEVCWDSAPAPHERQLRLQCIRGKQGPAAREPSSRAEVETHRLANWYSPSHHPNIRMGLTRAATQL